MAILTYNAKNTNQDEILKRIALVGYDSDKFLAPNDSYTALPACCQYERTNKDIPLSPRLRMALMVNTDKKYMAGLNFF